MKIPNETEAFIGEKIAKKKLGKFAPKVLEAARDGRNTVSSDRALKGERMVSQAFKKSTASGGSAAEELGAKAMESRGVLGNRMTQQAKGKEAGAERVIDSLASGDKPSFSDMKSADSHFKDEMHDRMAKGLDNSAVHKLHAMRNEKPAPIQMNGTGYGNPGLSPVSKPASFRNNPPNSFQRNLSMQNSTFDNRAKMNGSAKILANKTFSY